VWDAEVDEGDQCDHQNADLDVEKLNIFFFPTATVCQASYENPWPDWHKSTWLLRICIPHNKSVKFTSSYIGTEQQQCCFPPDRQACYDLTVLLGSLVHCQIKWRQPRQAAVDGRALLSGDILLLSVLRCSVHTEHCCPLTWDPTARNIFLYNPTAKRLIYNPGLHFCRVATNFIQCSDSALVTSAPLGLVRQLGQFSPGSGPGTNGSSLLIESGHFFRTIIIKAFFRAAREVERSGMVRIFIRPGPTEQYFIAQAVLFTCQIFPAWNHVFRAWNGLNEQGLTGSGSPATRRPCTTPPLAVPCQGERGEWQRCSGRSRRTLAGSCCDQRSSAWSRRCCWAGAPAVGWVE
jgi:hypothetical protein